MIDPVCRYIITQHSSFIHIYVFQSFTKRKINLKKIIAKLNELYGDHYSGEQFIEFGEKYLNDYLIEKHHITFSDLLQEAFATIIHRFKHLAK